MRSFVLLLLSSSLFTGCGETWKCVDVDGDGQTMCDGDCWDAYEGPAGSGIESFEIHVGASDSWYDGVDQNCDGASDYDQDGDGYNSADYGGDDCDDLNAAVHPDAEETDCTDPVDYNCDGTSTGEDADRDGLWACEDCDDSDSAVGSTDGYYHDVDGDGYGDDESPASTCAELAYSVEGRGDCDDTDGFINPNAEEICDGKDNDCDDDPSDEDQDGDLFTCEQDCDDANASAYPGATEVWYDGVDQDCDGESDYDQDRDGYDSSDHAGTDCDDSKSTIHPRVSEVCDGVDQDCDGEVDEDAIDTVTWYADADADGYGDASEPRNRCMDATEDGYVFDSDDCDDADADVNPDAEEVCDGVDNDCDRDADEDLACDTGDTGDTGHDTDGDDYDADGYTEAGGDCDDDNAAVNPEAREVEIDAGAVSDNCADGYDNDCDGNADADDWECGDADADAVLNGIDALVAMDDTTLCVFALDGLTAEDPWLSYDGYVQGDGWGGFSSLASSDSAPLTALADADGDGTDDTYGWCYDFASSGLATGAWNFRVVSGLAADGSAAAPASCDPADPSTEWRAADLSAYCSATADAWCRTGYTATDGCGDSLAGGIVRVRYDASDALISVY